MQQKVDVIHHGNQITNQMKDEFVILLEQIDGDQYSIAHKAQQIRSKIEAKFRYRWSIIFYPPDSETSYSFVYDDEFFIHLQTKDYVLLAYIIPDQPTIKYDPRYDYRVEKSFYSDRQVPIKPEPEITNIKYRPTYYP
ncbi:hypothetical protein pb186bvf_007907 [Paramecium bursaria]